MKSFIFAVLIAFGIVQGLPIWKNHCGDRGNFWASFSCP